MVPAECMEYFSPLFLSSRCTSATSLDTLAVGVPKGIRQKSFEYFSPVSHQNASVSYLLCMLEV